MRAMRSAQRRRRRSVGRRDPRRTSHAGPPLGALVVVCAVAVFAIGAIVGRATSPDHLPGRRATVPASQPRTEGSHQSPRTRIGAVAAATGFLDALRWTVLVDRERRLATVKRFAAVGASPSVEGQLTPGVRGVRDAVRTPPVVARPVFIGYRVRRFTPRRATVSVWGMALFGSGVYEPVTQWATSTLDLVWQDGAWKIAGMRGSPGPSPRWSIEELARDASSFDEYRHVP